MNGVIPVCAYNVGVGSSDLTKALYNKVIALPRVPQSGMHTNYF